MRRDLIEPCRRCRSDLNAKLLIRCSNAGCNWRMHTYCFDPPRIANDPSHFYCPVCEPAASKSIVRSTTTGAPLPSNTLEYAKKRALKMPKPIRKVPGEPVIHPLRQCPAMPKQDTSGLESPKPRDITSHDKEFDWQTFCNEKVIAMDKPKKRKRYKLRQIVNAWLTWRRKEKADIPRQRQIKRQIDASKIQHKSVMYELTQHEQKNLKDWREKYKDEPENDDHYKTKKVTILKPQRASVALKRPPPPPKVPAFVPPEEISVDNYSIDMSDAPPTPETQVNQAAKEIQSKMRQSLAKREAIKRRKETQHQQLLLQQAADLHTKGAMKLQRWYRRILKRRQLALEHNAAATVINMWLRRCLAKKHHRPCHAAYMLQAQRVDDAKRQLQRERARKRAWSCIDRFFLQQVVPHINRRMHAVRMIQRNWRIHYCRQLVNTGKRDRSVLVIQCAWRQALARRRLTELRELKALQVLQKHIRGWYIRHVVHVEQKRVVMVEAAQRLIAIDTDATTPNILHKLGLHFYSIGDWWHAATCFERAGRNGHKRDLATTVAYAYSQHQAWHRTYDVYNLTKAFELYTTALADKETHNDPYVMHDYAILLFERGEYKAGLEVMSHVVVLFPQFEHLKQSLLWIGLVLQHLHRGDESVQYLSALLDDPPLPYTSTDMTILCALSYYACQNLEACKQGLATAASAWKNSSKSNSKAEMLFDLGRRATKCGHYLVAYSVFYYGLHRTKNSSCSTWFAFSDTLRHLGRMDESKQALDAAGQLDPSNSMVQTALTQWSTIPHTVGIYVTELNGLKDIDIVRGCKPLR